MDSNKSANTTGRDASVPLSDLLIQLEDYSPTIPDAVTSQYLHSAGFEAADGRLVKLISLAAQKFITDIANDSMQHCKLRGSQNSKSKAKDKRYTLTMDDLAPVLADSGVIVKKPQYHQ